MSYVIDASALLDAAHPDRAEWGVGLDAARRREGLVAPAILLSEVCNVVHCKRPLEFGPTVEARIIAAELLLAQAETVPSDDVHRAASAQVAKAGLTFYDAEYVALAAQLDCVLVTHDRAMAQVAVKLLGRARVVDLDGLRRRMASSAA